MNSRNVIIKVMRLTLPLFILLLLLSFFLLGQSYFEVKGRVRRLELLEGEVETFGDKKAELEEELAYRQSPAYVEREAREQLGYTKKGEVIVVLPDLAEKEEGEIASATQIKETYFADKEPPIWKRWGCLWFPGSWTCPVVEF